MSAHQGPVFIVGCSRSGTTLLQSILANTPYFVGFPETNVLYHVLNGLDYHRHSARLIGRSGLPKVLLGRLLNNIGLTTNFVWEEQESFIDFLESQGMDNKARLLSGRRYSISAIFKKFDSIMTELAGSRSWIEKSPQNIFCLYLLNSHFQDARFLHIVRDGEATIGSILDAANRYASFRSRFGGADGLKKAISYYNKAVLESVKWNNHPRHLLLRYEDLAAQPNEALKPLEQFLGIKIDSEYISYRTQGIVRDDEEWKKNQETISLAESKFQVILSREEQQEAKKTLIQADAVIPRRLMKIA
mgnify:CR=1 FL=1